MKFKKVVLSNGQVGAKQFNKEIKEIAKGGGIPRTNLDGTHKIFEKRGNQTKNYWVGALEFQVIVSGQPNIYRILKLKHIDINGVESYEYGYTYNHYTNIHKFDEI